MKDKEARRRIEELERRVEKLEHDGSFKVLFGPDITVKAVVRRVMEHLGLRFNFYLQPPRMWELKVKEDTVEEGGDND